MNQMDKFRCYKKIYCSHFDEIYKEGKTVEMVEALDAKVVSERISSLRKNVAMLDDLIWDKKKFGALKCYEQDEALKAYAIVKELLAKYENGKFRHLFVGDYVHKQAANA